MIDHSFYTSTNTTIINLDKWNSLPKNLQELLTRIIVETEPKMVEWLKEDEVVERQKMKDKGVEFIKFSPADAKWYVDSAFEALWEYTIDKVPETAGLRPLIAP